VTFLEPSPCGIGRLGGSVLNHCTVVGNSAKEIGGVDGGTLKNCIVYFNHPVNFEDSDGSYKWIDYCCTTPLPRNGAGNMTNAPLFVDYAGDNLRLKPNSPCINAGNNAYPHDQTDLDGNPRLVGAAVDLGAYEFQGTGISTGANVISWGGPTGVSVPVPPTLTNALAIAAASGYSLALREDGTVVAWGDYAFHHAGDKPGVTDMPPDLTNVVVHMI
jgi:hypothetical protein